MIAYTRPFLAVALISGLAAWVGCGGGQSQPSLQKREIAGQWRERPSERPPTMKDRNFIRELELAEGGSFKLTVTDMSGKPVTPARTAEGTWTTKGHGLYFTVTTDQLGQGELDVPAQSLLIRLKSRGMSEDMIETRDAKGGRTRYVRE